MLLKTTNKRRSTITYYIDRLAQGDAAYEDRLCQRLADRLLHIPLQSEESHSQGDTQEIVIKVHRLVTESGVAAVPVFSNKHLHEAWAQAVNSKSKNISIIGADLCKVLEPESWLVIDPGSEAELLLHPDSVRRIAEYGEKALIAEFGVDEQTQIIEIAQELQPPVNAADLQSPTKAPESKEPQQENTGLRDWLGIP